MHLRSNVVQNTHGVAGGKQAICKMRTDEPRTTRNQNLLTHIASSSSASGAAKVEDRRTFCARDAYRSMSHVANSANCRLSRGGLVWCSSSPKCAGVKQRVSATS